MIEKLSFLTQDHQPVNFYEVINPVYRDRLYQIVEKLEQLWGTEFVSDIQVDYCRTDDTKTNRKYADMMLFLNFSDDENKQLIFVSIVDNCHFPKNLDSLKKGDDIDIEVNDAMEAHYLMLWFLSHYRMSVSTITPSGVLYLC